MQHVIGIPLVNRHKSQSSMQGHLLMLLPVVHSTFTCFLKTNMWYH